MMARCGGHAAERARSSRTIRPPGIDGGDSWTSLHPPFQTYIVRLAVDRWGQLFVASTDGTVARTLDGGHAWHTAHAGRNARTLVSDPRRPGVVHMAGQEGYWRTVDGGATWQRATTGPVQSLADLAIDPSDPDRLYAVGAYPSEVFLSTDGGTTWSVAGEVGDYGALFLTVDPQQPARLLVAVEQYGLRLSEDHGATWTFLNDGLQQEHWFDIRELEFDPRGTSDA